MPIVRIDVVGEKPAPYRSALLNAVRAAVVTELGADDGRVTVRLTEAAPDCVDLPSCRTERFTVIEVLMYDGRTDAQKAAAAGAVRAALARDPGIEPSEVSLVFRDMNRVDLDVLPGEAGL